MRSVRAIWVCALVACGAPQSRPVEDDGRSFAEFGAPRHPVGTPLVAPEEVSQWQWVSAHCTEGPLDLAAHGFEQQLRVTGDGEDLLLIYDQSWPEEGCTQTVVQRAERQDDSHEFELTEEVRVALPSNDECMGTGERPRRGEVRRRGPVLEVLVQRSFVWCGGLEVRMVYTPERVAPLTHDQLVRHYVAHYNRRDATAVASLFSSEGSLVDPFVVTHTGASTRHDGRDAVEAWFRSSFAGVEWLALRPRSLETGDRDNHVVLHWSYMDPRLESPFRGQNEFTIAAGEIFESRISRVGEPAAGETEPAVEADAQPEG